MAQSQPDSGWIYQCDDIVIEPRAHRIERAGVGLSVEPKAYAVLVALIQQAGDVVGKDDLLDAAWGHRHVTPGVLTRAISQLRHALGDCAANPRYIATVHSLGYRFIGEVRRVAAPDAIAPESPPEETLPPAAPVTPTSRTERPATRWLAAAITLAVIVATLAAVSLSQPPQGQDPSPRVSPQPGLAVLRLAHSGDGHVLHNRRWPHTRRIATTYTPAHGDAPAQARAAGYLVLRPEQAPAAQE